MLPVSTSFKIKKYFGIWYFSHLFDVFIVAYLLCRLKINFLIYLSYHIIGSLFKVGLLTRTLLYRSVSSFLMPSSSWFSINNRNV